MNVWLYLKRKKKNADFRLLRLEPVSLVIKKGRLKWLGQIEHKDDTEWIKR